MGIFGDAADFVFGSGDDPGALGTGKKADVQGIKIDRADYQDPHAEENRQRILNSLQSQGAQAQGATINPNERASAYTANATGFGPSTSAGTSIGRQDEQFRSGQNALVSNLQGQLDGSAPSLGTQMLNQGTDRALAANASIAASGRGNGALGARTAANTAAGITQDAATQAAQIRMQEANAARAQLGDVLSGARGQDIGVNTSQAQLGQANNQFNAGQVQNAAQRNAELEAARQQFNASQQQQGGQFNAANQNAYNLDAAQMLQQNNQFNAGNDQSQRGLNLQTMQTGAGLDQQQINNNMDYYNTAIGQNTAVNQINSNNYNQAAANRGAIVPGIIGAGGQAVGMIAGLSDRTQKKNIKPADDVIGNILKKIKGIK